MIRDKDILTCFAGHMDIVDFGRILPTTNIILGGMLGFTDAAKAEGKIEAQRLHV
jgi:hypothetical protein